MMNAPQQAARGWGSSSSLPSPPTGSTQGQATWQSVSDDSSMSDDAMFESLIQQEKFDTSDNTPMVDTTLFAQKRPANAAGSAAAEITPPHSAHTSASPQSSRRNSFELTNSPGASATAATTTVSTPAVPSAVYSQPRVLHTGSHYSHTSDADLPSSSHVVVNPPLETLKGLQVHVHGISFSGAKSRVETQIRLRLELVRPVPEGETSTSTTGFERVGIFNHVKLPPLTGTKRRSKKHKQIDVEAEKTLFMDAAVVRATPPHERVFVCRSCQQREKKRAQRRKSGASTKDAAEDEQQFTPEDYQELGVDAKAPDALEQIKRRAEEEDEKRVVVFNCGDFVAFEEGACILPTRITCYCRHHREKTGFCVIFTMRDYRGNLIATGSTPPIMITDDHKSVAAAAAAAAAAATSTERVRRISDAPQRSRAPSTEVAPESSPKARKSISRRAQRSKPYGDAEERNARRSTGQNTPALSQSPTSEVGNPDFWQAFAAMANLTSSPPASSRSSSDVQTPHTESCEPAQDGKPMDMQEWVSSMASQGSLSSQTLDVNPQSLPGFDLNSFMQSIQRGQREGDQASVQQLMILARSLPTSQSLSSAQTQTTPIPSISKLIPGEGPTSGGIEVTVLGENFVEGLTCYFGDVAATSTRVWGSNTLLCLLPASAAPGPVAVTVKGPGQADLPQTERYNSSLQLFTYVDATDRALMELALQVVGLQMTGQMQSARDVAMRVVGSGPNQGMTRAHGSGSGSGQTHTGHHQANITAIPQSRNAVAGLFANGQSNQSFQDSVITFLRALDVDLGLRRSQKAIRLANKQGHTLLHLAVILGFQRLVSELVNRGCPLNARDNNGMTALHFAALHGRVTISKKLLHHGAAPDVVCESGMDALDVARAHEQVDVEVILEEHLEYACESEVEIESECSVEEESEGEYDYEGEEYEDEVRNVTALDNASEKASREQIDDAIVAALTKPKTTQDEKATEASGKTGLKSLVSGGFDLTNFSRWQALPTGFPLHAPVVSVFQMALPPNFFKGEGGSSSKDMKTQRSDALHEGHVSTWRHIIEESALWINPLSSPPPPAYDSLDAPRDGSSRFPAIAPSHPRQARNGESADEAVASPSATTLSPTSHKTFASSSTTQLLASSQSSSSASASSFASSSLQHPSKKLLGKSTAQKVRTRSLKDDRMLVYFWLPMLFSVLLLVFFAKPTSVLSYGDLMSFLPF